MIELGGLDLEKLSPDLKIKEVIVVGNDCIRAMVEWGGPTMFTDEGVLEARRLRTELLRILPDQIRKQFGDWKLELAFLANVWQPEPFRLHEANLRVCHDGADRWWVGWDTWENGPQNHHTVEGTLREVLANVPDAYAEAAMKKLGPYL
jgi:hypothetical protein